MTTLTLNIIDQSILPELLDAISQIKGVTIAPEQTRARELETQTSVLSTKTEDETKTLLHDMPEQAIASAMEVAWKEYKSGKSQTLSSVLSEIKEERVWR